MKGTNEHGEGEGERQKKPWLPMKQYINILTRPDSK